MLIGRICHYQTRTISAEAENVHEVRRLIQSQVPEGWILTDAPVTMAKASKNVVCEGTIVLRDEVREVEGADIDAVRALVPEGWQLLSVRDE